MNVKMAPWASSLQSICRITLKQIKHITLGTHAYRETRGGGQLNVLERQPIFYRVQGEGRAEEEEKEYPSEL